MFSRGKIGGIIGMKLSKETLLDYYEMKKASIEESKEMAIGITEIIGWNNQLFLIESLILELDLFD
jgi:hypothetical protein